MLFACLIVTNLRTVEKLSPKIKKTVSWKKFLFICKLIIIYFTSLIKSWMQKIAKYLSLTVSINFILTLWSMKWMEFKISCCLIIGDGDYAYNFWLKNWQIHRKNLQSKHQCVQMRANTIVQRSNRVENCVATSAQILASMNLNVVAHVCTKKNWIYFFPCNRENKHLNHTNKTNPSV